MIFWLGYLIFVWIHIFHTNFSYHLRVGFNPDEDPFVGFRFTQRLSYQHSKSFKIDVILISLKSEKCFVLFICIPNLMRDSIRFNSKLESTGFKIISSLIGCEPYFNNNYIQMLNLLYENENLLFKFWFNVKHSTSMRLDLIVSLFGCWDSKTESHRRHLPNVSMLQSRKLEDAEWIMMFSQ